MFVSIPEFLVEHTVRARGGGPGSSQEIAKISEKLL